MRALAVIISAAAASACAADFQAFGLVIGSDVGLRKCPRMSMPAVKGFTPPYAPITSPCLKPNAGGDTGFVAFPPGQQPEHAVGGQLGYRLEGGRLAAIWLTTAGAPAQQRVFDDLVRKYGAPQHEKREAVVTAAGANFEAVRAIWAQAELRVEFMGVTNRADTGELVIGTPAGVAALRGSQAALTSNRPM